MSGVKGRRIIKPQVMEHFQKAPGSIIFVGELASRLNVSETQVQECIATILRQNDMPGLQVEARGRSWRYRPEAAPKEANSSKRMFEEIGPARDGSIIIQDDGGKLYRAQEL
jgi:biotin operon repressor